MTEAGDSEEYIQGIGNEVFYFFLLLSCLLVVVGAWFSTQVVEPVVSSVILVERRSVNQRGRVEERRDGEEEYLQNPSSRQPEPVSSSSSDPVQNEDVRETEVVSEEVAVAAAPPAPPVVDIPQEERVTVRLKFLNETQRDVEASLLENIGTFKRRNFTVEISENKNVRLIFNGQVLREEANTLRSYGIFDKCVVHCLIHQQASPQQAQHSAQAQPQQQPRVEAVDGEEDFDVSELFIPVLGVGLIFLWYFAFTYSAYFNMMSSTALLGLTSLFLLSVYGTNFHVNVAVRAR